MAIQKITAAVLGNNAVTAASVAAGTLSAADIADNSITAAKISASTSPTLGGLTTNGNVTINTDANSTLTISDGGTDAVNLYGGTGDELYLGANNAYKLRFKTTGDIVMDNGGSFGIGTSTPYSKLWIVGPGIDPATELNLTDANSNALLTLAGNNSLVRLQMGTMDVSPYGAWIQASYDNTSVGGDSGREPLVLNPLGGNVGIGTKSPDSPLHILGADAVEGDAKGQLVIGDTAAYNASPIMGIIFKGSHTTGAYAYMSSIYGAKENATNGNYAGYLGFATRPQNSLTQERMRITSTGEVGIGTTDPDSTFEVRTNDASGNRLGFIGDGATTGAALWTNWTTGDSYLDFRLGGTTSTYTKMRINNYGNVGIGTTSPNSPLTIHGVLNDATLVVTNSNLANSTTALGWAGRGGRYLTSNGSNWDGDGQDPGIVIGSDSGTSLNRKNLGIVLHNEDTTNNTFSPGIFFGGRSTSGSYNTAYGYIMGKRTGTGPDSNWAVGELHIDVAGHVTLSGTDLYMASEPAWKMTHGGAISHTQQPSAWGHFANNQTTNGTGWVMGTMDHIHGMTYQNNATHGYGLTVIVPGYYSMTAIGLYATSGTYAYIGWCVNGTQLHHWHSNHSFSNHDFVSHVIHYCNAGDHITLENSNQTLTSTWGGLHSTFSVWKIG